MPMNKTVAHLRISRELASAEAALDEALLRQSSLFSTMVAARRETGVGLSTGHEALLRLAKSQQTLLSAGSELARVHSRLREIGEAHDVIRASDDCPEGGPMKPSAAQDDLREVA